MLPLTIPILGLFCDAMHSASGINTILILNLLMESFRSFNESSWTSNILHYILLIQCLIRKALVVTLRSILGF